MNDYEIRELYDTVQEVLHMIKELQEKTQCQCNCCMED
jgi:hypothetical protein